MQLRSKWLLIIIISMPVFHLGMAHHAQYDEEARQEAIMEKDMPRSGARENPAKQFAGGIKEATYDSTKDLLAETAHGTANEAPILGTAEGARVGSEKVLDHTVKGAYKVATFGFGSLENYEVIEPESGSEDTTKIKIKIPGT